MIRVDDAIYNSIGKGYSTTRAADLEIVSRFLEFLQPSQGGLYAEIGCGTGNYTIALQGNGYKMVGLDPSRYMLETARERDNSIEWIEASAEQLPILNDTLDGVICCMTIHHWSDLVAGFSEIQRVLRNDGKFILFTSTKEQMAGYWLNHYFPEMMRLSIAQMPSQLQILDALKHCNLTICKSAEYFVSSELKDKFLYCGKMKPSLYLDSEIRRGISSFSLKSPLLELEHGLDRLATDIKTGEIREVMDRYTNDLGDYLFLMAKKADG